MKKFLMYILCFICLFEFNVVNADELETPVPSEPMVEDSQDNTNNNESTGEENTDDSVESEDTNQDPSNSLDPEGDSSTEAGGDVSTENQENNNTEQEKNEEQETPDTSVSTIPQPPIQPTTKLPINGTYSYTSKTPITQTEEKAVIVEISNTDLENNKELAGSKLQVQDKDGKVLYEWETTNEKYVIDDLEEGTYYLVVVSTVEDYEASQNKIEFVVNYENEKIEVKVENVVVEKVPDTLSPGSILILCIAMLDIAIGIGIIVYVRQNKVKE